NWRARCGDFGPPFQELFRGGLDWSLRGLVDQHQGCREWVDQCFSDPSHPYDAIWHRKLGFARVPNGDMLAFDLDPRRSGAIVYLSHDDGGGHGYVLAASLIELLDRWVPLACPGPEDWQWLPFVPFGEGPIDPAGENGVAWRKLMGLTAAPPCTPASAPDDALFDQLVVRYRAGQGAPAATTLALRALRVCSTDRAEEVIGLLDSPDPGVQEGAARLLGSWRLRPAVAALKRVALTGSHNGRIAAMSALRQMPWEEAKEARASLRTLLDANWHPYLG
ncbi:MAG: hypothetical protein Q8M65_07200, partial [Rhodoglobus sp.]|nr:hypothetical protein [Rhodoglobus sp.]